MKTGFLVLIVGCLLTACGRSDNSSTTQSTTDSSTTAVPKPRNCKTILEADKLGKTNDYQESAKAINVAITLEQDSSATETANGCYFNNTVTILATKKSGSRVFKRTLLKDDLLYFTKSDELIERSLLKNTTYKPTFNGQKYITITMQLIDPVSQKTADYLVYMNYFGEIVKVR